MLLFLLFYYFLDFQDANSILTSIKGLNNHDVGKILKPWKIIVLEVYIILGFILKGAARLYIKPIEAALDISNSRCTVIGSLPLEYYLMQAAIREDALVNEKERNISRKSLFLG